MKDEEIKWIRGHFEIPKDFSDDNIRKIVKELEDRHQENLNVFVGNSIELNCLNRSLMKEPMAFEASGELKLWYAAGSLFIYGFHGPCCVWARATLEYMMQRECLENPNICMNLKRRIEKPVRNPGLDVMYEELVLAGSWSDSDREPFLNVKRNGDYCAHHRMDKIVSMKAEDREFKKVHATTGTGGLKVKGVDERGTFEFWRGSEERRMAKQSLEALLLLLLRHRGITKYEVDQQLRRRVEDLERTVEIKKVQDLERTARIEKAQASLRMDDADRFGND